MRRKKSERRDGLIGMSEEERERREKKMNKVMRKERER